MATEEGLQVGVCWFDLLDDYMERNPDDPLINEPVHWIGKMRVKFEKAESIVPRTPDDVGMDLYNVVTQKYWTRTHREVYDDWYEQNKGYDR